jgi:hypothetical protein
VARQPQGGCKVTPFFECLAIPQSTGKRTGNERTDATNLDQSLRYGILFDRLFNLPVKTINAVIELPQIIRQVGLQSTKVTGQSVLGILKPVWQCTSVVAGIKPPLIAASPNKICSKWRRPPLI